MSRYERVRVDGKTLYLRDPAEVTILGTACLSGIEVDRHGEEVSGKGFDERSRMIDLALIAQRVELVVSKKYGWLVTPVEAAAE